jgi:L-alanine-DL-glutamate epimerase-like enolase superfamily enzyme
MKITSVKTAATVGHCMHLWVKVTTDAGITGLGECVHGGPQAIAIIQYLEEKLIGRDPFAIDAHFEELRRSHVFEGGFAGALITALTGIEIALWDLKGKALHAPIYELLGGKFRDKIRVYADCSQGDELRGISRWWTACWAASPSLNDIHFWASAEVPTVGTFNDPPFSGSTSAWSSWWTW